MTNDPALDAHEHAEHAQHAAHERSPFVSRVSITVAVLAVMAASAGSLETVEGGRAITESSEAVLAQDKATDSWNEYQADSLKRHMYEIASVTGGSKAEAYAKEIANAHNFFHKRVDGLIVSLAYDTTDLSHFDPFIKKNIPVIFFDRVDEKSQGTRVVIDNYAAGYQATSHLVEQGCKRIAHVTASLKRNVYADRLKGYRAALEENNIAFDKSMLFVTDLSEEASLKTAEQVMKISPMPDGIFITNDFCAAIMMQVFKDNGIKIPGDIAVVGFNNDVISKIVTPKLTTIDYPGVEMGEIVAKNLIDHLQGITTGNQFDTVLIKSELIVRESSKRKDV